jgi:hypothetical protein
MKKICGTERSVVVEHMACPHFKSYLPSSPLKSAQLKSPPLPRQIRHEIFGKKEFPITRLLGK